MTTYFTRPFRSFELSLDPRGFRGNLEALTCRNNVRISILRYAHKYGAITDQGRRTLTQGVQLFRRYKGHFSHVFSKLSFGHSPIFHMSTERCVCQPKEFQPKKALVFVKTTRFEYERESNPKLSDIEFKALIEERGSDYPALLNHHNIHKNNEAQFIKCLKKYDINVRVCNKYGVPSSILDDCDIVFSTGGDGTYLLAANKVHTRNLPVIGINTDPGKSEGHLCLPKKYSDCFEEALEKLFTGKFNWSYRQRIRITLRGKNVFEMPKELHGKSNDPTPEYRFMECLNESIPTDNSDTNVQERVLPVLALNDVFIGESLSARVSYLNVSFDHQPIMFVKSSGLIVSTGTGSTSWYYNVNKLTHQQVEDLLKIIAEEPNVCFGTHDVDLVDRATQCFNSNLLLEPDRPVMAYVLRDFISRQQVPGFKPRGLASLVLVKSMCKDASLVVDGGLSFPFNDGTSALLEMYEQDALRTVTLTEA